MLAYYQGYLWKPRKADLPSHLWEQPDFSNRRMSENDGTLRIRDVLTKKHFSCVCAKPRALLSGGEGSTTLVDFSEAESELTTDVAPSESASGWIKL